MFIMEELKCIFIYISGKMPFSYLMVINLDITSSFLCKNKLPGSEEEYYVFE